MKPFVKWWGGKTPLIPLISNEYNGNRLVEPFVGGMSVALGLMPKQALLNDLNPYVINLYKKVQEGLEIDITPLVNTTEQYYANRDRFNYLIAKKDTQCKEIAELFYYLNKTGANGLIRFNSKGYFNTAKGSYTKINYRTNFDEYTPIIKDWTFVSGDFEKLELLDNDFIYADPPYDNTFTNYNKKDFSWEDQVRLANWLSKHPGKVVASNNGTDRIVNLYKDMGFTIKLIEVAKCSGMGKGQERKPMMEMFAIKESK